MILLEWCAKSLGGCAAEKAAVIVDLGGTGRLNQGSAGVPAIQPARVGEGARRVSLAVPGAEPQAHGGTGAVLNPLRTCTFGMRAIAAHANRQPTNRRVVGADAATSPKLPLSLFHPCPTRPSETHTPLPNTATPAVQSRPGGPAREPELGSRARANGERSRAVVRPQPASGRIRRSVGRGGGPSGGRGGPRVRPCRSGASGGADALGRAEAGGGGWGKSAAATGQAVPRLDIWFRVTKKYSSSR